jgi:hypothetical protein
MMLTTAPVLIPAPILERTSYVVDNIRLEGDEAENHWTGHDALHAIGLASDILAVEILNRRITVGCVTVGRKSIAENDVRPINGLLLNISLHPNSNTSTWTLSGTWLAHSGGGLWYEIEVPPIAYETHDRVNACILRAMRCVQEVATDRRDPFIIKIQYSSSFHNLSNHVRLTLEQRAMTPLDKLLGSA